MFRPFLLPCACFGVALGLAAVAPIAPARGQDRSTYERLDRLERDLNMLQRQVYRGAPPPPMMGGDPGGAVNAQLRMDRLEGEMRELTGRVEETHRSTLGQARSSATASPPSTTRHWPVT